MSAIQRGDRVFVEGGGTRAYLVRAVGDAGKDVYVVSGPNDSLGTWVDIEQVTLAEFGKAES